MQFLDAAIPVGLALQCHGTGTIGQGNSQRGPVQQQPHITRCDAVGQQQGVLSTGEGERFHDGVEPVAAAIDVEVVTEFAVEQIIALAATQRVVAEAAFQRVSRAAGDRFGPGIADDRVIAQATEQLVEFLVTRDRVAAVAAEDAVVAFFARQIVVAGIALDGIRADVAAYRIRALATRDGVEAGAAFGQVIVQATVDDVIAGLAAQRVVAVLALDGVVADTALDGVTTRTAFDGIRAAAAANRIRAVVAEQGVVIGLAVDLVITVAAGREIRTGAAVDPVIARIAVQRIIAVAAVDRVLIGAADDRVIARIADQPKARNRSDNKLSFPFESNPYYLSGYYALRNGWDTDAQYLSMDAGPFGTNHQHGDKLSITVSADGAPFIVDPGTSLYTSAEPGPRNDLRYGFLHNVITIDGIDPNTGWDRHYAFDVLENRWVTNPVYDFLEGTYEYRNNLLDALWRRSVLFVKDDYWIVLDALYGDGEHHVESNLQFMVDNEVQWDGPHAPATAPNGATLHLAQVFGEGLQPEVLIGDTHFPGTTFLTQYPTFVDWKPSGRGWVGTFGNLTPLAPVRNYPAPALLKSGKVGVPLKSVTVLTPSIRKQARNAQIRVIEDNGSQFQIEITANPDQVDQLHWQLADWPDHSQKIPDDSGWWARSVNGSITRIILSNITSAHIESNGETIEVAFDAPFEGRIDRTSNGWTITPDSYNAVAPNLLAFTVDRDGQSQSYQAQSDTLQVDTANPLAANR